MPVSQIMGCEFDPRIGSGVEKKKQSVNCLAVAWVCNVETFPYLQCYWADCQTLASYPLQGYWAECQTLASYPLQGYWVDGQTLAAYVFHGD